jgi:hypothetical protein
MSDSKNNSSGFQPIDGQRIKKSRRTGVLLVITIILLIAALGGLVYLVYPVLFSGDTEGAQTAIKDPTSITDVEVTDVNSPGEIHVEVTSIPNLSSLFGLTLEEVKGRLGGNFQLIKTDAATDATNPAIKQLATFSYEPVMEEEDPNAMSNASLPNEHVYLSLDEGGKVIDVYYTCDMRLLGYPVSSFIELLSGDLVTGALASAGVSPRDFSFVAPDEEGTISYDNKDSANRKIIKQATIFSGRTTSETVPTAWTLTVTYDFGAGVETTSDYKQATRTISLRLA